jgi:hypothetical protein
MKNGLSDHSGRMAVALPNNPLEQLRYEQECPPALLVQLLGQQCVGEHKEKLH